MEFLPVGYAGVFQILCQTEKGKREWEKYTYLNAETEGKNSMGMTRNLFKKMRDTKGKFHAKMGSIKDTNGTDLTEAEDSENRWQEYRKELYKKDLHDPDNHDAVITHL